MYNEFSGTLGEGRAKDVREDERGREREIGRERKR